MTAYLHDSTSAPAAAHLPPEPPSLPNHGHDFRHPELNSVENTIPNAYPSDSWDNTSSRHPHRHSRQPHKPPHRQPPVESIYPDSEAPVVAPMTFVSSPYLDNGSILTQTSYSGGAARKEERGRRSWTDHSSYMSSDNHHLGVTRLQKRAIHTEEPLADDSQDALLMLVRISLSCPLRISCSWLTTWHL